MEPGLSRFPAPGCGIQHPESALAPGRRAAAGPEEGARRRSALYEGSPARPRSRLRWEPPGEGRGGEGREKGSPWGSAWEMPAGDLASMLLSLGFKRVLSSRTAVGR